MKELIEEYSALCRRSWEELERKDKIRKKLDALCHKEAISFRRKAKRLFKDGSGWTLFDVKGSANLDHRTRPVTVTTDIKVDCGFYADEIRGSITMYGDIGQADEILRELDRLINGEVSK